MEITNEIKEDVFAEIYSDFYGKTEDPYAKITDVDQNITTLCRELKNNHVISAKAAYVINSLGIRIPDATLISIGVTDIMEYDFDKVPENANESVKALPDEGDLTYSENTDMVAISVKQFKEVLTQLKIAIGKDTGLMFKYANDIIFDYDKIITYDGYNGCIVPIMTRIKGGIDFKLISDIVKKFDKDSYIQFTHKIGKNGSQLELKCNNAVFNLELDNVKPPKFDTEAIHFAELPPDFVASLQTCLPYIHKDRELLSCINIEDCFMYGCDNVRAIKYTMDGYVSDTIAIPKKICLSFKKFHPVEYGFLNTWVFFKNEFDIIIGFPKSENFIIKNVNKINTNTKDSTLFKFDSTLLSSMLEKAVIVADKDIKDQKFSVLELLPTKLICRSGSGRGRFEESIKIEYTGEHLLFKVMPEKLLNLAKMTDTFYIGKNNTHLIFTGETVLAFCFVKEYEEG